MTQKQVKVRLDEDLIDRLKNISADMNISFSSLVNELLSKGLEVDNSTQIAMMCIKFDNLLSTIRRIENKISPLKKNDDPC
jgi:antitoxin component of RelBE/YafQ-DinJ toxin-antitoxin module